MLAASNLGPQLRYLYIGEPQLNGTEAGQKPTVAGSLSPKKVITWYTDSRDHKKR